MHTLQQMVNTWTGIALQIIFLFILCRPTYGDTTSTVCSWSGTAPFCNGKCSSDQTRLPSNSDNSGTGSSCFSGSKALCCTLPRCPADFDWMQNDAQDDPCFLASQITEACASPNQQEVLSSNGNSYSAPTDGDQTSCTCSSPLYALASGCAYCQNGTYVDWPTWSSACSKGVITSAAALDSAASGIPDLPPWSLFDVTQQSSFDPVIAKDVALGLPVSASSSSSSSISSSTTSSSTSTSTSTTATSSSSTSTISSTSSNTSTASSSASALSVPTIVAASTQSKNNTGAAVGGAIGGAALLLLTVYLIWRMITHAGLRAETQSPEMVPSYPTLLSAEDGRELYSDGNPDAGLISHWQDNSNTGYYYSGDPNHDGKGSSGLWSPVNHNGGSHYTGSMIVDGQASSHLWSSANNSVQYSEVKTNLDEQ